MNLEAVQDRRQNDVSFRGAGFILCEPKVGLLARLSLHFLFGIRPAARERMLFGKSRACLLAQHVMQRLVGGPTQARIQFSEGPTRGSAFKCLTSEKYFLMGTSYEKPIREVLQRAVRPGMIVYEIGAHCGYWAVFLSHICGRQGHVFAFEPSPINFERLLENLREGVCFNVTAVNKAVSDENGCLTLREDGSRSAVLFEGRGAGNGVEEVAQVESTRLDDFVFLQRHAAPALLLFDVEGHGGKVLQGAREVLGSSRPAILCEVHSPLEETEIKKVVGAFDYLVSPLTGSAKYPRHVFCESRTPIEPN